MWHEAPRQRITSERNLFLDLSDASIFTRIAHLREYLHEYRTHNALQAFSVRRSIAAECRLQAHLIHYALTRV